MGLAALVDAISRTVSMTRRAFGRFRRFFVGRIALLTYRIYEALFGRPYPDESIWLIGGSNGWHYDGSTAVLHQYIRSNFPEIRIFWVIRKESGDLDEVRKIGPVVMHGSLRAYWLSLRADVQISSHSRISDIADYPRKHCRDSLTVHVFHGVTGLKKRSTAATKRLAEYDVLIASGHREKDLQIASGCPGERFVVTGYPQHDRLPVGPVHPQKGRQILFLPTWRPWLAPQGAFVGADMKSIEERYFRPLVTLLREPLLVNFLLTHRIRIKLFLHRNMRPYLPAFAERYHHEIAAYVDILPATSSIQREIIASSLLITDYSSVSWDFLYMRRPVVFYTFDLDEYLEKQGAYLRLPDEFFGPHSPVPREVARMIVRELSDPEQRRNRWEALRSDFFAFDDGQNSRRIVKEILQRVRTSCDSVDRQVDDL